jgi:hypothetical protein
MLARGSSLSLATALVVSSLATASRAAEPCTGCIFLECHTPARAAPPELWGELEPSDDGVLPPARDSSGQGDYVSLPTISRWVSVEPIADASGSWLFALAAFRFQVYNLANPDLPKRVADVPLSQTGLQHNITGHTAQVFSQIRSAPDDSSLVAVGAESGVGFSVFRTATKSQPQLLFQDSSGNADRVHTARIGATDYAFAAGDLAGAGARVYDMTAASNLTSVCYDSQPNPSSCPGVHVGALGAGVFTRSTGIEGAGNFVAVSTRTGMGPGGFLVYDVSNPAAPVQLTSGLAGTSAWGVAMWHESGSYYLAVRTESDGRIYDVSCIAGGPCAAGDPIWMAAMTSGTNARVSVSRSDGTPLLYWSRALPCNNGTTGELLFDVTDPSSPRALVSPEYFRFYHWDTDTGFNYFAPMEGRFLGTRFYRAAWSVLDAHRWSGGPPPGTGGSAGGTAGASGSSGAAGAAGGTAGGAAGTEGGGALGGRTSAPSAAASSAPDDGGCGCRASKSGWSHIGVVLVALWWLRRRRERR